MGSAGVRIDLRAWSTLPGKRICGIATTVIVTHALFGAAACEQEPKRCTRGGLGFRIEQSGNEERLYRVDIEADANAWHLDCVFDGEVAMTCDWVQEEIDDPNLSLYEFFDADRMWLIFLEYRHPLNGVCTRGPNWAHIVIREGDEIRYDTKLAPKYEEYCEDICGTHQQYTLDIPL